MKVLASDLDGTLYFGEEVGVKPQDIKAIKEFQKAGNLFGICSGRTYAGIKHAIEDEDVKLDFYILVSGACLMDKDGNYLYYHTIEKNLIQRILNVIDETNINILFCHGENYYRMNPNHNMTGYGIVIHDIDEAEFDHYDSLHLGFDNLETLEKVKKNLKANFSDEIEIHHNVLNLDITPKGNSKGIAIKNLHKYLSVKQENIYTIGDSYNDISMLDAVKTAFTFHESDEEVKKHAKYIVSNIAEAISIIEKEE